MPIVPDAPFPKAAGNPIRSKDWNDLVYEAQRLDNAKVNKAGDGMTGPLTIAAALNQAALGVGTTSPGARLHVQDGANPTVLRIQSTASFGKARVELWSDPQGSGSEWRPGYLESIDLGGFRGGLSFVTNGSGSASRTGSVEALRVVNGRAGFGVNDPAFRIDVADRIRLRESTVGNGTAGIWLFQTTPNEDRAFIGMNGDNAVGLWGNKGANWALSMDVTTGNVGIRTSPAAAGGAALTVAGDLTVTGRLRDNRLQPEVAVGNSVSISSITNTTVWNNLPNMNLSVQSPGAWFKLRFQTGGVQAQGVTQAHAEFRLLVGTTQHAYTLHEFHGNGWELREVSLERLLFLAAGTHSITVQWSIRSPQARGPIPVPIGTPIPEVRVTLSAGFYNDTRFLSAIEL
jgi:hypothetical protein